MSFVFGIVLSLLTAGTATWAVAGHRLAALPGIARVLDYVDGGYNLPSERAVDELVAIAESRRAHVLGERLPVRHDLVSVVQPVESSRVPALFSDVVIDAPWRPSSSPVGPVDGWRGWLRGGYNMPTEREIDVASPKTLRGAYRQAVPDGWIFADEDPAAYAKSVVRDGICDRGLPFPSHAQREADAARNGWGAP